MQSVKQNGNSLRPDSFVCEWLCFQWRVYNFTDCGILNELPRESGCFDWLIRETCLYGNEHFLSELFDCYPNISNQYFEGDTILHIICRSTVRADLKARCVLSKNNLLNSTQNKTGSLPIHIAAVNGNSKLLSELLKVGKTNINARSRKNLTALHIASHYGIEKNVDELLLHGDIDINAVDSKGDTAFHHSAGKRHFRIYTRLANDNRCDQTRRNINGRTAKDDLVIQFKHFTLTKSYGEFLNLANDLKSLQISDTTGNTPLHWSMMDARDGLLKFQYIINRDIQLLKISNENNNRPIHIAARHPEKGFLEYLLNLKVCSNINAPGYKNRMPLHMACFKGYLDHVDLLLHNFDLNINAADIDGNTSLHIASMKGYYNVIKKLKSFSWCRTDMRNMQNNTPMDVSSQNVKIAETVDKGTLHDLRKIIEQNVSKYEDIDKNTLLHICASSNTYARDKAKLLVDQNPDMVFKINRIGYMPIHTAAAENNVEVVEYLIGNGSLNVLTPNKQNPLHIASYNGSNDTVTRILRVENINVNVQDRNKNTPAHLAAMNEQLETLSILENHSTYVHGIHNEQGKSPYDICPVLKSLREIFCTGSASSVEAMLKHWGKCLTLPVEKMLLPLTMELKYEKAEKFAILANLFQELIEQHTDSYGNSFVHLAIFSQDIHLLHVLIDALSSSTIVNKVDHTGYTAWDYASLKIDIKAIQELERHLLFEQSSIGLGVLSKRVFTEIKFIDIYKRQLTLHHINGEIWSSCGDITVYTPELETRRRISSKDIGLIRSMANVLDGVAAATSTGLCIINYSGKLVRRINSDNVYDVRYHSGRLFCASGEIENGIVKLQVYDKGTWQRIRLKRFKCRCQYSRLHTFHVNSENIALACCDTNIIYTMTHTGDLLSSTSYAHTQDDKHTSNINMPYLCHTGSDALLLADSEKGLLLRNESGWSHVLLEPKPFHPRDAVYAGGALFVLSRSFLGGHIITKYMNVPLE